VVSREVDVGHVELSSRTGPGLEVDITRFDLLARLERVSATNIVAAHLVTELNTPCTIALYLNPSPQRRPYKSRKSQGNHLN